MVNNTHYFTSSNITPYFYSDSDEEDKTQESSCLSQKEPEPLSQQISKESILASLSQPNSEMDQDKLEQTITQVVQFKTSEFEQNCLVLEKISLAEAENLIQEATKGIKILYLSPLHVLFIKIMKMMQQFSRDSNIMKFKGHAYTTEKKIEFLEGNKILPLLAFELHLLFYHFQEYSNFKEGKINPKSNKIKIVESQQAYTETANLFVRLFSIIENQDLLHKNKIYKEFKSYFDVLYYLCHNEDFLHKYSQSLSNQEDLRVHILNYPPTQSNMQFFLDALNICTFSSIILQQIDSQSNDPYQEIQHATEEIKKLFKGSSNSSCLNQSIAIITQSNLQVKSITSQYSRSVQNFVMHSQSNPSNKKLSIYFEDLEKKQGCFLKGMQQMLETFIQILEPWEKFKKQHIENLSEMERNIAAEHEKIKNSLSSFKKILKNSNISGKQRKQIQKLIKPIEELSSPHNFCKKIYACVTETLRIPMNTYQEMSCFFSIMQRLNQKADAFHQSLISSHSEFPCSAFTPIDLLIHQISQLTEQEARENPLAVETPLLIGLQKFQKSIITFNNAFAQPDLLRLIHVNMEDISQDFYIDFTQSIQELKEALNQKVSEQENLKISHIHKTLNLLSEYLEDIHCFPAIFKHLTSTLVNSLGDRFEISNDDLPLIQKHMHLIARAFTQRNFDEDFAKLEQAIQKKLQLVSENGKFFWKLNYKCTILAKLEIKQMQKNCEESNRKLQTCNNQEDALFFLHEFDKKMKPLHKSKESLWGPQLTILANMPQQDEDIVHSISSIFSLLSWNAFLETSILEILSLNPTPKKPLPSIPHSIDHKKDVTKTSEIKEKAKGKEEEKEEEKEEISFSMELQEVYHPSQHEFNLDLLNTLKKQQLMLLSEEEPLPSFFTRTSGRKALIQNSFLYFALIQETKQWASSEQPVSPILHMRSQVDHLLLLEATEKIALASLRMGTKEFPHIHILTFKESQRPLIYSHNGELLVHFLHSANKEWFTNPDLHSSIRSQEHQLKKVYWFQEELQEIPGIMQIQASCEQVWQDLAKSKKPSKQNMHLETTINFQDCRSQIHKLKRNQAISFSSLSPIDNTQALTSSIQISLSSLPIHPQCYDIVRGYFSTIERILNFNQILHAYDNPEQIPLFFMTRAAEIQVSLLSSILILALSTLKTDEDQPHPLFLPQDEKHPERPLFHSHRVDKLWDALKVHLNSETNSSAMKMLDTYLPLFIGDPRYPYPNKTVMTNELVSMHERVYLLEKLESEWLTPKDMKQLKKYLTKEDRLQSHQEQKQILKQEIVQVIRNQQKKNELALQLAENILHLIYS